MENKEEPKKKIPSPYVADFMKEEQTARQADNEEIPPMRDIPISVLEKLEEIKKMLGVKAIFIIASKEWPVFTDADAQDPNKGFEIEIFTHGYTFAQMGVLPRTIQTIINRTNLFKPPHEKQ